MKREEKNKFSIKKSAHRAQKIEKGFGKKIGHCEFCHSLFLLFHHLLSLDGGKGESLRNFSGNPVTHRHVKVVHSIDEHRYGPPKKHVSQFFETFFHDKF